MNLILFGMQGCGKTSIGKLVAKKLRRAFIDTDQLIEEQYRLHRKKPLSVRDIYLEIGELAFRALEYEAIQSLQDVQNSVIAVGGGAFLHLETAEYLVKKGQLIYLMANKETIKKRIFAKDSLPAYLDPEDLENSFEKMYAEREEVFQKISATKINMEEKKEEEVINFICALVKKGK
ncbi:MAG: shikimate kinase [Simkania negevensis]|nr:shikimate kinase [Simkania negevensis]